ncbi:MAG: hypothetical protein EP330_16450 [Deltaproteobacteria bacterium]|nr:MAG: hypothetical protein EP330_16450 [Deltaproteobacteria bacterium]
MLAACSPNPAPVADDLGAARFAEASAEAFGILALLDDAATTEDVLDRDVGLDARAARSLVAHRNGPDGVHGTPDDDAFDDLAEVDAQYYVGTSAIDKLAAYAEQAGYTPTGGEIVGAWDGVTFTFDQVTGVLALANDASEGELDDEIGLDRRAVRGILEARPIASMNALADAYYVGKSALTDLRDYVDANAGAGVGGQCDTSADCAEGLVCMGEIAYGNGIFCVDESMYGNFTYDEEVEIPDDGETGLTTAVNVQGLATVPVDVVLTLDIDHPRPSDLVVVIDNFNGYEQVIWEREENPPSEIIVRAFPSDDMVNGEYRLHIEDVVTGEAGVLRGWNLYVVSNWD